MTKNKTDNLFSFYRACLTGAVLAPRSGAKRIAFQCIVVILMATSMLTLNWILREQQVDFDAFMHMAYEYPVMLCIALVIRILVANPLVDQIAPHVSASLTGLPKNLTMTAANVGIMATTMTFFGTLVSQGVDDFSWATAAQSVPASIVLAFSINFFFVGPLVKGLFRQIPVLTRSFFENKANKITRVASRISIKVLVD